MRMAPGTAGGDPLRVSVVVPTYKRPALLRRCLEALLAQTLPRSLYEIVVVDDGRDELSRQVVQSLAASVGAPRMRSIICGEGPRPSIATIFSTVSGNRPE